MKKKVIAIILSLVMVLTVFTGCRGGQDSGTSTPSSSVTNETSQNGDAQSSGSSEVFELSLGHIQNPGHNEHKAYENFKKLVEEKTNGRIKITIYPSGQLGSDREMQEQCILGTLDIAQTDGAGWSQSLNIPELGVFNLPFLYNDLETQKKIFDNVMMKECEKRMAGTNVMPIMIYTNSIRNSLLIKKPITKLEDIKGMKFRVPEISVYVNTWKALGANPTTTPWSEVYTALQQGVVEGCEADAVGLVDTNLQEIGNYYSRTGHMGGYHIACINREKWNSLPADLKEIFLECCKENAEEQYKSRAADDAAAEQKIANAGVTINDIAPEELARMVEACQSLYEEYRTKYNLGEVIDEMLSYGKK